MGKWKMYMNKEKNKMRKMKRGRKGKSVKKKLN
jgi:hypothetical protein